MNENINMFHWKSAVDAIEIASQVKEPNALAYVKNDTLKNIIEEIAKIPGKKNCVSPMKVFKATCLA